MSHSINYAVTKNDIDLTTLDELSNESDDKVVKVPAPEMLV